MKLMTMRMTQNSSRTKTHEQHTAEQTTEQNNNNNNDNNNKMTTSKQINKAAYLNTKDIDRDTR